ncbi:hypothetical protein RB195_015799 [Necator americanus]|uniref:Uncharacterized protein n=1 Tax=Necator americanus TaxID=51031 RepID=A0ABR1E6B9_NECAM
MRSSAVSAKYDASTSVELNGTNISECTSYVFLGREMNMMNNRPPSWAGGAYKSIEEEVKKTKNIPTEENAESVIERAIEKMMLRVFRFTQVRDGIRSSLLRQRSKIRDAAAFAKESKLKSKWLT